MPVIDEFTMLRINIHFIEMISSSNATPYLQPRLFAMITVVPTIGIVLLAPLAGVEVHCCSWMGDGAAIPQMMHFGNSHSVLHALNGVKVIANWSSEGKG